MSGMLLGTEDSILKRHTGPYSLETYALVAERNNK